MFRGFLRSRARLSTFLRETWDVSATMGLCCATQGITLVKRFAAPSPLAVTPGSPTALPETLPRPKEGRRVHPVRAEDQSLEAPKSPYPSNVSPPTYAFPSGLSTST